MGIEELEAAGVGPERAVASGPSVALLLLQVCGGLALAVSLSGCADAGGPRVVTVAQERPFVGPDLDQDASTARRFGFEASVGETLPAQAAPVDAGFDFQLPAGWISLAPTSMRALNLRVERDESAECSLTLLAGEGGGLRANVDRWRGQMGLTPLGEVELALLESSTLMGLPATRIDFTGSYAGMTGDGGADYRMVGLLAVAAEGSAFLKFVGPADVVAAELTAFDALAASIGAPNTSPAPTTAPTTAPTVAPDAGSDQLTWSAPASWTMGPPRMMREVTFTTDPAGTVECYISVLGGDGGGIRSNFDRWRGQMGAPPLSTAELNGLERVECLGTTAILIEIEGPFEGMSGQTLEDALMLGAVASLEGSTVFVKLVGPRASAELERERFREFVESMERGR